MEDENSNVCIITEYMPNGSLKEYLRKKGPTEISFEVLIDMLFQVMPFRSIAFNGSIE